MKQLYLLIALSVIILACQLPSESMSDEELLAFTEYKMVGMDGTLRRSLSDIWVNTSAFCESDQKVDCVVELDRLQHQLNDLNPVPVPQMGAPLPVSAAMATYLYRKFVKEHQREPLLAVFQQLYPRILLNKYGIKTGTGYNLIAYYTQQMAVSDALDFDLRTELLSILKGHIPVEHYKSLLERTLTAAINERQVLQKEITRIQALIALAPREFNASDPGTYATNRRRKLLKTLQNSTLQANINRLRELQREIRISPGNAINL